MPVNLDPYLFTVFAAAAEGVTAERLEKGILEEIEKIGREGVEERELRKVKNQQRVKLFRQLETISGKANHLGTYEVFFGDYSKLFAAPAEFEKVKAEDIQRVAKQYFTRQNRTVGILQDRVD